MKKILAMALVAMMALSLVACGGKTMQFGTFNIKLASGWDYTEDVVNDRQTDRVCKDSKVQEFIQVTSVSQVDRESAKDNINGVEGAQGNHSYELVEVGKLEGCKVTYTMDSNGVQTEMTTYVLYDAASETLYYIGFGCGEKVMKDFLAQLSK